MDLTAERKKNYNRKKEGKKVNKIQAVIGTNAWGDAFYEKMLRGSYVEESVIRNAVLVAVAEGIPVFDTARDY